MNLKELDSFKMSDAVKFHNELNPNLWYGSRLRPEVKKQLKKIADDFLDELGISGLDVLDLTVSGSNAAYSYTPHSDLDLHILIDMNELPNDEVYRELFNAKKNIYNDSHNIKIHGVPVELYVQDTNEPVISLGEYSILQDKWLKLPSKRRANLDQNSTRAKYEKLHQLIQYALKSKDVKAVNNIIKKIRQYRQAGLDSGGEFGPENLAYKALRNQDYITKLYDLRDKLHSEELTIETMYSQFVNESTIKLSDNSQAKQWIEKVYNKFPQQWQNNHLIPLGDEQFAMFELVPSFSKRGAVDVKWFQAYPLRQGVGSKGMKVLQDLAKEDGISLTLYPWDKGQVSQSKLIKFYKGHGFIPSKPGAKNMYWDPSLSEAFDQPYPIKWEKGDHGDLDALAKLPDGSPLSIMFNQEQDVDGDEITQVQFYRNNSQEVTGEGDAQRIFATVLTAIQQYIKKRKPIRLTFAASKEVDPTVYYEPDQPQPNPESRAKLYDRLVQRYAKAWGYRAFRADNGDLVIYELSRINKKVAETDTMQYAAEKTPVVSPYAGLKDNQYRGSISEASGYIPSEKQKNDPRFSTALTVDIKPDSIKKNAKAFNSKISRAGIPPTLNPSGKF